MGDRAAKGDEPWSISRAEQSRGMLVLERVGGRVGGRLKLKS